MSFHDTHGRQEPTETGLDRLPQCRGRSGAASWWLPVDMCHRREAHSRVSIGEAGSCPLLCRAGERRGRALCGPTALARLGRRSRRAREIGGFALREPREGRRLAARGLLQPSPRGRDPQGVLGRCLCQARLCERPAQAGCSTAPAPHRRSRRGAPAPFDDASAHYRAPVDEPRPQPRCCHQHQPVHLRR